MKVLILGGAGYIGSVLCEYLIEQGDEVIVMDTFMYEGKRKLDLKYELIRGDIRNINDLLPAMQKADAVVNLAAISNDPSSDLQPDLTWEINYQANELIAKLCHSTGKRVVYASSCSVYGFSEKATFKETSKLGPVTLYAHTKMLSEHHYLRENVDSVVLRFATVYGYSPKPRFDLVVNTMIGTGYFTGKLQVNGGYQWRPVVHVKDVAQAIYRSLHAKNPKHRVYNVGSNEQNYQIKDLANIIAKEMPGVEVNHDTNSVDGRSYKVNFDRIKKELKYKPEYSIKDSVKEFYEAFKNKTITGMDEDVYYRVKYLKKYIFTPKFIKQSNLNANYLKIV